MPPTPTNPLPLHHDLYLIAHGQSGRPLIPRWSMALGLAAAALLELALDDRVVIARGRVALSGPAGRTGDAVADHLLALVAAAPGGDVRFPIRQAAADACDLTRDALVSAGVMVRIVERRMGLLPYSRYRPAAIAPVLRASAGVRTVVEGWRPPDTRCAAMCGLMAVLRLEEELCLDQPRSRLVARLREIADTGSREITQVVGVVETLVTKPAIPISR
ncbi:GOLPH3/VPS74 family protein [Nonomuraea sp. SYSU D8015]|uniref:GOLPH3/VPS74 family protein n=1 Tax=Nonomuraea sp. SYSU D8015 TaxID=2593644 RepID=UPI0016610202|nr:GPP34 family phosphoprotein [Nonomuraea sp. SYSU D8015]